MSRRSMRLAWTAVTWCALVVTAAALLVGVMVPTITGAQPYTVLTGSMEPTYAPGTLVVVRSVDLEDVGVGDVITYQIESGQPTVATHRVIGTSITMDGEYAFRTRGDANDVPDAEPVVEDQIRGKVWYSVPYLGSVNSLLTGPQRDVATFLLVVGLFGYAATMFAGGIADRRAARPASGGKHLKQGTSV